MLAFPFTYILPSVIFIVMFNKSILVHISWNVKLIRLVLILQSYIIINKT